MFRFPVVIKSFLSKTTLAKKSESKIGNHKSRAVVTSRRWPKRIGYFFLVFVITFSSLSLLGIVFPDVRSSYHKVALLFDKSDVMKSSAAEVSLFKDLPLSAKEAEAVYYLKERGIVSGYDDGTFRPGEPVTRSDLVVFISKVMAAKPHAYTNSYCFKDVNTQWFAPFVCSAKNRGWVNGYEGNLFRPESLVSKAEGIKMVLSAFNISPQQSGLPSDVEWFVPYVSELNKRSWLWSGFDQKEIHKNMLRSEASDLLYKVVLSGFALR